MERAYDHMEWGFILKVLRLFGFHARWVVWIQQCISTVSFSVLLNGAPFGFFSPERGLRQGYPLSPFLFILGSEVLSRFLIREENIDGVHGLKVTRGAPSISHLLFADDLLVFCRANAREVNRLSAIFEVYTKVLGQKINLAKSALFCRKNTHPAVVEELCNILHVKKLSLDSKYLGLPLFIGR